MDAALMKKSSVVILPGGMDANGQGDDDNDDKNSGHHAEYGQHQRVKLHLMGFAIRTKLAVFADVGNQLFWKLQCVDMNLRGNTHAFNVMTH